MEDIMEKQMDQSKLLKYYATFKVRKFESFDKINTFSQKPTICIGLQREQIFSVNM